ncbi:MAG: twin-arginine translocation pathway signal protein [Thermoleophilia bacterium]|nr:twin-arginine translocation pathway signal protein [Thermoleophilia bacterium]
MNQDTTGYAEPGLATIEIEGMTRESFLIKSALAAGAVYGVGMVGPFVRQAFAADAPSDEGDIKILNFALTLEYLEAAFYKEGLGKVKFTGTNKSVITEIGANENEHVSTLISTIKGLGGTPVTAPGVMFPYKDEKSFLKLAQVFEDTGVSAYNGAGPAIKNKDLLAAAGSIVQVEARHAARIRLINGEPAAPAAFDKALTTDAVLAAVKPFIKA